MRKIQPMIFWLIIFLIHLCWCFYALPSMNLFSETWLDSVHMVSLIAYWVLDLLHWVGIVALYGLALSKTILTSGFWVYFFRISLFIEILAISSTIFTLVKNDLYGFLYQSPISIVFIFLVSIFLYLYYFGIYKYSNSNNFSLRQ